MALSLLFSVSAGGTQVDSRYLKSSAVDSKGVRRYAVEYPGPHIPWIDDQLKAFAPEYPYADRAKHHEGAGLFCVALDPKTGSPTKVAILKSTGFSTLDNSAVASLFHWRWKPGRWREINVPVRFQIRSGPLELKPGQKVLPHL